MKYLIITIIAILMTVKALKYLSPSRTTRLTRLAVSIQKIEFRPEKDNDSFERTIVDAKIGDELSEVAANANIPIAYKCRKGECGTCEVNMNGKW